VDHQTVSHSIRVLFSASSKNYYLVHCKQNYSWVRKELLLLLLLLLLTQLLPCPALPATCNCHCILARSVTKFHTDISFYFINKLIIILTTKYIILSHVWYAARQINSNSMILYWTHSSTLRVRNTVTVTCSITTAPSTSILLLPSAAATSRLDPNCRQMHSTTLYRPYVDRIPDTISHSSVVCCHATNLLLSISGEMRSLFRHSLCNGPLLLRYHGSTYSKHVTISYWSLSH
jgi:hypothetical protein